MTTTVKFLIEKVDGGYTAYAKERAAFTEGDTLSELKQNIKDVLEMQCEHLNADVNDLAVELVYDIPAFFDAFAFINTKSFAERIGMNYKLLNNYTQRVKKPGAKQKERIEHGIQSIIKELRAVHVAI